jgi:asparagine synthase (glutamine-hydrolysing)
VNFFVCLIRPSGGLISEAERARYTTAPCCRGRDLRWQEVGGAAVLVYDDLGFGPTVSCWHGHVGVGVVRLDNREEVERWVGAIEHRVDGRALSDLDLVTRVVARHGERRVPDILGDMAFVAWNPTTRKLVAARDAFGVKRIFFTEQTDLVAFASRAELLAKGDRYDIQTLIELASVCNRSPDRTVYAGVYAVPAGTTATLQNDHVVIERFWSPEYFEPTAIPLERQYEYSEIFRELFTQAVRARLTGAPDVWAQLSGGPDSSSVVSMAQWLAQRGLVPHGVAGTISWVYRWSTDGDEREYSNVVAQRYDIHNEVMLDDWWWEDGEAGPPLTDEPDPEYPMFAREQRTCRTIRQAGGRILLTGFGSDQYLLGNMFFFADWIARGHIARALQEMLRRAALGRVSVWDLAYQNAILPMLPSRVRRLLVPSSSLPSWIVPNVAKRFGLEQTAEGRSYAGRIGRKYSGSVMEGMRAIPATLSRHNAVEEELEVRHPFLYRPLVEFGLRLPPEMCVQPHARKWVLRQAMHGILPEVVRTRVGKGSNPGCIHQSLIYEREKLQAMLADPILAQLGCVDARKLRAAYATACQTGAEKLVIAVVYTLALETWLQVRSGRWIAGG